MASDLFISCAHNMVMWFDKQEFTNNPVIRLYPEYKMIGQSAFVDINIDGHIDHILQYVLTFPKIVQNCAFFLKLNAIIKSKIIKIAKIF
jgi:hypothetical protein